MKKEGIDSYIQGLVSSDTPPGGIPLDRQTALALLPRINPDPAHQNVVNASIENGFDFHPENPLIVYRRAQQTTSVRPRLLKDEDVPQVTTTTYDIRVVFTPPVFPDTMVVTAWNLIDTNHHEIVPKPQDSMERIAVGLQTYDSTIFSPPSPEEEAMLQRLGLQHPSQTYLASAARRLQTIPAHSEQQEVFWITVFSSEAWQELLGAGRTTPHILGLGTGIIRVPGTALLTLDQDGLHKTDNPQEYPLRKTAAVADRIETHLMQLLQSSDNPSQAGEI